MVEACAVSVATSDFVPTRAPAWRSKAQSFGGKVGLGVGAGVGAGVCGIGAEKTWPAAGAGRHAPYETLQPAHVKHRFVATFRNWNLAATASWAAWSIVSTVNHVDLSSQCLKARSLLSLRQTPLLTLRTVITIPASAPLAPSTTAASHKRASSALHSTLIVSLG